MIAKLLINLFNGFVGGGGKFTTRSTICYKVININVHIMPPFLGEKNIDFITRIKKSYKDRVEMTSPTERLYNPWNLANRVIPDGEITRILTTYGIKERPASMDLFRQACIHRSYVDRPEGPLSSTEEVVVVVERPEGCMPLCTADNEAIEFVGDSLLGCVIALYLHERYPEADEGFLTRIKTKLVNGTQLAKLARKINLGKHILMSNHVENIKGRDSQKILEDAFEAFLAALFKDLGFDAVNSFVINLINSLDFEEILIEDNYKDTLLKYAQHTIKNCTPEYILTHTEGPPHNRLFTVIVQMNGVNYESGTGKSKKQAEQVAAEKTLKKINLN
jgi:ribonuclease-3